MRICRFDNDRLGIVSNGHALRGWKGNIGQIGHVQVDPAGPLCHCGKRGCLEAYCTADAILRDARIATLNREHPAGPNFPDLPRRIEDIVASDDPIFVEVLKQAAKRLGAALGEAIAILDPELVLLGGGILQKLGDSFVETLVLEIPKSAMPTKPLPPVKSSSFGADAGLLERPRWCFTTRMPRVCGRATALRLSLGHLAQGSQRASQSGCFTGS